MTGLAHVLDPVHVTRAADHLCCCDSSLCAAQKPGFQECFHISAAARCDAPLPVSHFTPRGGHFSSSKSPQNKSLRKLFCHIFVFYLGHKHQLHSGSFLCSLDIVNLRRSTHYWGNYKLDIQSCHLLIIV